MDLLNFTFTPDQTRQLHEKVEKLAQQDQQGYSTQPKQEAQQVKTTPAVPQVIAHQNDQRGPSVIKTMTTRTFLKNLIGKKRFLNTKKNPLINSFKTSRDKISCKKEIKEIIKKINFAFKPKIRRKTTLSSKKRQLSQQKNLGNMVNELLGKIMQNKLIITEPKTLISLHLKQIQASKKAFYKLLEEISKTPVAKKTRVNRALRDGLTSIKRRNEENHPSVSISWQKAPPRRKTRMQEVTPTV